MAAAAAAAVNALSATAGLPRLEPPSHVYHGLLVAASDCSEWGAVAILELVAAAIPGDGPEAALVAERCLPLLHASNAAVALTAGSVIFKVLASLEAAPEGPGGAHLAVCCSPGSCFTSDKAAVH